MSAYVCSTRFLLPLVSYRARPDEGIALTINTQLQSAAVLVWYTTPIQQGSRLASTKLVLRC